MQATPVSLVGRVDVNPIEVPIVYPVLRENSAEDNVRDVLRVMNPLKPVRIRIDSTSLWISHLELEAGSETPIGSRLGTCEKGRP